MANNISTVKQKQYQLLVGVYMQLTAMHPTLRSDQPKYTMYFCGETQNEDHDVTLNCLILSQTGLGDCPQRSFCNSLVQQNRNERPTYFLHLIQTCVKRTTHSSLNSQPSKAILICRHECDDHKCAGDTQLSKGAPPDQFRSSSVISRPALKVLWAKCTATSSN